MRPGGEGSPNPTGSPITITADIANNLGSDSNTRIVTSSSGDAAAQVSDTWITTFQNFSGTTSSDPRLGHVLQQSGAPLQLSGINFANGDDNPFWGYHFTVQPGQTVSFLNFVVVQPTKAAAAAKSAQLASGTNPNEFSGLTAAEKASVRNFNFSPSIALANLKIAIDTSGAKPLNKYLLDAQMMQIQMYLAAGPYGKPGACFGLNNLKSMLTTQAVSPPPGDPVVAANLASWAAQIDAIKAAVPC